MICKSVLIGLDGATFSILDPLMAQDVMPFLKTFVDSGVRAELRSVIPPLTPPAWTSLMTGRSPGHHGIFDFFQLGSPGSKQIRLATSKDVRCETIWSIANRHNLRTTVLNFPVTFPPPTLDGYLVSGWMPWRQLRLGCHPPSLYDRLKALPGFNARELAMDMELESKATEGCNEDEYVAWVELHMRREQHWLDVLRYLMREDSTDLMAILFDGPDKIQHLCWRFLDPTLWPATPTALEQKIRNLCFNYFRQLDQVLKDVVTIAGDEATVLIASDHGFGVTKEVFHINAWLEQAGYLTWSDQAVSAKDKPGTLGMGHLSRHTQWLDWERTKAYTATPTSNGIHFVMADQNGGKGVQFEQYDQFRIELMEGLYNLIDPATGEPVVSRIWLREEAFPGSAGVLAPDLTLTLRDGGLVSILPAETSLKSRPIPVGTHRPIGVFMANGPGIRGGVTLPELSILDVAPLLLYSLGLDIPDDMEGHLPLDIYEPSFRVKRPVEIVLAADKRSRQPPAGTAEIIYDEEAEAAVLARLRNLGYIE